MKIAWRLRSPTVFQGAASSNMQTRMKMFPKLQCAATLGASFLDHTALAQTHGSVRMAVTIKD